MAGMAASSRLLPALLAAAALAGCAAAPGEPAAAAAGERGLWVGAIQLCRDTVESASAVIDVDGSPAVTFLLKPAARARLAEETRRQIGRRLPIRLDGRTLAEPVVNEPILGGMAQVSALPEGAGRIERAAGEPC
jgi:hypothetical protein